MYQWLDQRPALEAALPSLNDPTPIALDTEFVRERTYFPKLALVQLSAPGQPALLADPLCAGAGDALRPLLADSARLKIMHSPSEDLQAFLSAWGWLPAPIFDTQLAAALCGLGAGLGYQALVEKITGKALEKGETRSDWLQRPLTESQRHYAAEDVLHLHEVHAELDRRLGELDRRSWLDADCRRMLDNAAEDRIDPNPHLAMRSAEQLDGEGQARLRRLMLWREQVARRSDRPKTWILDNELLLLFAKKVPENAAHFRQILDRNPRAPRKARDELWEEIARPLSADERDIPLLSKTDGVDKQLLRALQDAVAKIAAGLDIPEGLLASRKHLEALIVQGSWTPFFNAWRRELLAEAFQAQLRLE